MTADPDPFDIAIVGAGIAGASVAYFASPQQRVLLLERENQPGLHSTGRSAAMFMESYGSPQVRALTRASRAFLQQPPPGFCPTPLLRQRGAMFVATAAQHDPALALHATLLGEGCPAELISGDEARRRVPVLRAEAAAIAVVDPLAADLDVNALHQAYLRGARAHDATLVCDAGVSAIRRDAGAWRITAGERHWRALLLVNAAGAWVDQIAALAGVRAIGIQPKRRSAFVFAPPPEVVSADWPCVAAIDESWYFKPDAGLLLGSPANADSVAPHDVQAEELDIATGIHRIEHATTLQIRRPRRIWAGLRSFVADGDLVGGFDPQAAGFFWVAALGGYGIQTSPAMGAACAALLQGQPLPQGLLNEGLSAAALGVRAATA